MIQKVLLVYKKSAYSVDFLEKKSSIVDQAKIEKMMASKVRRFKKAHENHHATLDTVESVLKKKKIKYDKFWRGKRQIRNIDQYDLVITVGGDGTFLEASRHISCDKLMLGVNSDTKWSVGRFSCANKINFEEKLDEVIKGKHRTVKVTRLHLRTNHPEYSEFRVLNDILVAHTNPAAMSRYAISINKSKWEKQRSSGVWVSTAAGSTSAIGSAGGKFLPLGSKKFQYLPREPYEALGQKYEILGGVLESDGIIKLQSLMLDAHLYVDGCHLKIPFIFGEEVTITQDKNPLHIVQPISK